MYYSPITWRSNFMTLCKTNDIKKGVRAQLANGWYATMADNRKEYDMG
jgi:hypothetical protein